MPFRFLGKKLCLHFFFGTYDACKIMPLLPAKEKKHCKCVPFLRQLYLSVSVSYFQRSSTKADLEKSFLFAYNISPDQEPKGPETISIVRPRCAGNGRNGFLGSVLNSSGFTSKQVFSFTTKFDRNIHYILYYMIA